MIRLALLLFALLSAGCSDDDKSTQQQDTVDSGPSGPVDEDRDGYTSEEDCDDGDPTVNPSADEICDGVDNDCDASVDEDVERTYYEDADGDGFGDGDSPLTGCTAPAGSVPVGNDCDDANAAAFPGGVEVCDGADNDCDGETDEDQTVQWYADSDGDGYGDAAVSVESCEAPEGYIADSTDCDDTLDTAYPGATELCDGVDNDCDGAYDEDDSFDVETFYEDRDEDGFGDPDRTVEACLAPDGYVADSTDCDDLVAITFPGADEVCDDADNDCDGTADEDAVDAPSWYSDTDSDGYGDPGAASSACDAPTGTTSDATDCDDGDGDIHPGADETCDGVDQDCDAEIDEDAVDAPTWHGDGDGDGYGDPTDTVSSCEAPAGYLADDTDCDDGDDDVHPGADELCNDGDDDCDGTADEDAVDAGTFYQDRDEDGFGDPTRTTASCEAPDGYVALDTDCDDLDAAVYPGADELCNGGDDDCDGETDEDAIDGDTWFADADSDGYGDLSSTTTACEAPAGYTGDDTDCDDGDAAIHPDAEEVCDDLDNDCDGTADDGATDASTWYADLDRDGYGDASRTRTSCDRPTGYLEDATDCDDGDRSIHPDADELCDSVDNDCDGSTDENSAVDASTWYQDRDEDGYGDATRSTSACAAPSGYVADDTDCDDLSADDHPGADETCDAVDNDCDGATDEDAVDADTWYADADGDRYGDADSTLAACDAPTGFVSDDTDCDDGDASTYPGASEVCDDEDDDCDGSVDEGATDASAWYTDDDGDGYGDPSAKTLACDAPTGSVSNRTDCDDADAAINPAADEVCDGDDNDCDGSTDESSAVDAPTWYQDRDEDGYGDPSRSSVSCSAPSGYVALNTDCNDLNANANPGEDEVCDDIDNDCDGDIDSTAIDASTWYADADSDAYGDADATVTSCDRPTGYLSEHTDCDDTDSGVHPGATETCDDEDDDCDGSVDEGASDAPTWYADADSDGYGSAATSSTTCDAPTGYVSSKTDCDDTASAVNPAADEVCDDIDNDCDGLTDDSSASDIGTWYADRDGDGYGDASRSTTACDRPTDYVTDKTDCDDTDSARYPGKTEICDDKDNDCDGTVDDSATDASSWYPDADSDGYGSSSASATTACDKPTGYVSDRTDCNDSSAACFPGATEVCDDLDNDCDGSVDEAGSYGTSSFYPDDDGDGYGDETGAAVTACDPPTGYVSDNTDCDDADLDVNPGETEYCDGTDNDCSGDEDQVVTFTSASGVSSDVSANWNSGTDGAAKSITVSSIGAYTVCSGVYYVSISSSATSLTITGLNGSTETILSGGGTKRTISATRALGLSGLTLTDGYSSTGNGGNLSTTSTLTATDVVFENGHAVRGGNLYCSGCSATLDTVEVNNGNATYGGGIYVTGGVLSGDTVFMTDDQATYGGCMYLASASTATLVDSSISTCNATSYGGGVYAGGASSLTMTGSEIVDSVSADSGGGVYLTGSTMSMSSRSNIEGNTAALLGGGLYLTGTSTFSCTGSSTTTAGVWGNTALLAGGAYMTTSDTIQSTTCDWTASKDNDLYDVVVSLVLFYTKGNNATFTCGATGC